MEIIGAGFGRTGTKSLKMALEALGYDPCYHMEELLLNPSRVGHWENANQAKPVDWAQLFQGYTATVDFPGSMYYKQILKRYPKAKVILTVRDPEKWHDSVKQTIYSFNPGVGTKLKLASKLPFSSHARHLLRVIKFIDKAIWKDFFEGKFEDKTYAIQRFNDHIKEVQQVVPSDQLLIYEVKDGWEPLCAFLDKEVPLVDFPRSNAKEDFAQWAEGLVRKSLGGRRTAAAV